LRAGRLRARWDIHKDDGMKGLWRRCAKSLDKPTKIMYNSTREYHTCE